jgi:hypothetical protein
MIVNMLSLDETDFILHVKSPVVELDVDDLDCCYNCITLLIRLLIRRKRTNHYVADTAYEPGK